MKYIYKIVTIILAIVSVVVLITTPIAKISVKSLVAQLAGYIGQYKQNEEIMEIINNNGGKFPEYLTETFKISDFFSEDSTESIIVSLAENFGSEETNPSIEKLISPALTLVLSFVAIIICAIAVIASAFTKNNRKVIYSSIFGIVSCFMFSYSFETIAEMFLSEKISFATILQSGWGGLIGDIVRFEIPSSFWAIAGIFAAIIIFTVVYNYTLPEKEKQARKEMLGE